MKPIITIAVFDNDAFAREGIIQALNNYPGIKVIASAGNEGDLSRDLFRQPLVPDIILYSVNSILPHALKAVEKLRCDYANGKIIIISRNEHEFAMLSMIKAGIAAYLIKNECSIKELIAAIHAVMQTGYYYSTRAGRQLFDKAALTQFQPLTEKEMEILNHFCNGVSMVEIAAKMFLSKRTVEYHFTALCERLKVGSRQNLIAFALKAGIV